jgi:PAS domain S-box-containing protein
MIVASPIIRILYVEDDESLGILFTKIVTDLGHTVEVAANGHDGIALYNANPHDIVFLDYNLPDTDGISIARKIFLDNPDKLIVLVTGEGNERLASEALALGVSEYIVKDGDLVFTELIPSILTKLVRTVEERTDKAAADTKIRRLEAITANMLDVVSVLDAKGKITYISPSVKSVLGYSIEERLGKTSFDLIHPDDLPEVAAKFASGIQEPDSTGTARYRYKHKNGNWVYLESSARNHRSDPLINGVIVHTRDVTERVKANNDYASIIDTTGQGFWRIDSNSETIDVNDALSEMLGYRQDEMLGLSIFDLVDDENRKIFEHVDKHRRGQKIRRYEISLKSKYGENIPTEFNATTLYNEDDSVAGAVAFVTDLTDRKEADRKLAEREALFSSAFHANPAMCSITTLDEGRYLDVNKAFENETGYSRDEAISRTASDLNIWSDQKFRNQLVTELKANGRITGLVGTYRRKSGEIR